MERAAGRSGAAGSESLLALCSRVAAGVSTTGEVDAFVKAARRAGVRSADSVPLPDLCWAVASAGRALAVSRAAAGASRRGSDDPDDPPAGGPDGRTDGGDPPADGGRDGEGARGLGRTGAVGRITARPGQTFRIDLPYSPVTGYTWSISGPLDESVIRLVSAATRPSAAALRGVAGAGGSEVWTFRAMGEGTTVVPFESSRPWDPGSVARYPYIVEVVS